MKPHIKSIIVGSLVLGTVSAIAQMPPSDQEREAIIYFAPQGLSARSAPEQDLAAIRRYYQQRFPKIQFDDYVYGALNFSADARAQYDGIMDSPPFSATSMKAKSSGKSGSPTVSRSKAVFRTVAGMCSATTPISIASAKRS